MKGQRLITVEKREEMFVDKSGSFRAAMTIIDANVGGKRGCKDLALIFKVVVRLHHSDGVITGSVRFKVSVPHETIPTSPHPKTTFKRSGKRP